MARLYPAFYPAHRYFPMFNKRLKQELAALREELSSLVQVKESLESEMLVLTLEPDGRIQSVNQNFLGEMLYKSQDLIGRAIEDIVPAHVKSDEFHHRFKNAMTRGEHGHPQSEGYGSTHVSDLDAETTWSQDSTGVPGGVDAGDRFGAALAFVSGRSGNAAHRSGSACRPPGSHCRPALRPASTAERRSGDRRTAARHRRQGQIAS